MRGVQSELAFFPLFQLLRSALIPCARTRAPCFASAARSSPRAADGPATLRELGGIPFLLSLGQVLGFSSLGCCPGLLAGLLLCLLKHKSSPVTRGLPALLGLPAAARGRGPLLLLPEVQPQEAEGSELRPTSCPIRVRGYGVRAQRPTSAPCPRRQARPWGDHPREGFTLTLPGKAPRRAGRGAPPPVPTGLPDLVLRVGGESGGCRCPRAAGSPRGWQRCPGGPSAWGRGGQSPGPVLAWPVGLSPSP